MRRALAVILGLLVLPSAAGVATARAEPDRIIVQRASSLTAGERAGLRADAGVEHLRSLRLPATEVVQADDPAAALERLRRDPDVVYAELDNRMAASSSVSFMPLQWALLNDSGGDMDVPDAWARSTGKGVTVGVVDTGAATHVGLYGQIDGRSADFVGAGGSGYADRNGHGTFIAGLVAARPYNGYGTAGVAPDSHVAALRALTGDGAGAESDVAEALDYAGDHGLRVVNASLNGPASATVERAIAAHPGTLFVVSAGNTGANDDATPSYPCSSPLDNVLCVGASDRRDSAWASSNRGKLAVDLFAPGVGIESTWLANRYGFLDGTSMAAGNVAGEAALVLAAKPTLSTHDLKAAILQSGDPVAGLVPLSATGRRANAAKAVALAQAGPIPADADEDGVPDARDSTPRGADADGDGVGRLDDACPAVAARTANGCPAPAAPTTPTRTSPTRAPTTVAAPAAPAAPADPDGDGRTGSADACPAEHATTPNGCPVPKVRTLRVSVAHRTRRTTARAQADRAATVTLGIERRRCAHGRCRWTRVASRTAGNRSRATLTRRLARGRYRAVVMLRSAAGTSRPKRHAFRVR